ncbi:hypothetical protein PFLmoz3_00086 [Pseudomonas fluorescens]|uniref:Uncharacterized protein n=1 Tax=Pseudomonas fluorescens TaxID=294 RepID=A0A120G9A6_PSEFL|nr:hypothetical protein PFLmoz3_00086 [Pseudomonas fluorescens]
MTDVVMEIPRCFSISIQSEVAWRSDLRDFTVPATAIALPISNSFSVMVVLPASGWEIMAKVRRFATSAAWWVMGNRLAGESKKGGEYSANARVRTTVEPIGGG